MSLVITVSAQNSGEMNDLYEAVSQFVKEDAIQEEFGDREVVIEADGADLGGMEPEELMDTIVSSTDEVNASDVRLSLN